MTPCEAHHTKTGGMGMKGSDYAAVPLTMRMHRLHDMIGKTTFWRGKDLEVIIKKLRRRYEISISERQKP